MSDNRYRPPGARGPSGGGGPSAHQGGPGGPRQRRQHRPSGGGRGGNQNRGGNDVAAPVQSSWWSDQPKNYLTAYLQSHGRKYEVRFQQTRRGQEQGHSCRVSIPFEGGERWFDARAGKKKEAEAAAVAAACNFLNQNGLLVKRARQQQQQQQQPSQQRRASGSNGNGSNGNDAAPSGGGEGGTAGSAAGCSAGSGGGSGNDQQQPDPVAPPPAPKVEPAEVKARDKAKQLNMKLRRATEGGTCEKAMDTFRELCAMSLEGTVDRVTEESSKQLLTAMVKDGRRQAFIDGVEVCRWIRRKPFGLDEETGLPNPVTRAEPRALDVGFLVKVVCLMPQRACLCQDSALDLVGEAVDSTLFLDGQAAYQMAREMVPAVVAEFLADASNSAGRIGRRVGGLDEVVLEPGMKAGEVLVMNSGGSGPSGFYESLFGPSHQRGESVGLIPARTVGDVTKALDAVIECDVCNAHPLVLKLPNKGLAALVCRRRAKAPAAVVVGPGPAPAPAAGTPDRWCVTKLANRVSFARMVAATMEIASSGFSSSAKRKAKQAGQASNGRGRGGGGGGNQKKLSKNDIRASQELCAALSSVFDDGEEGPGSSKDTATEKVKAIRFTARAAAARTCPACDGEPMEPPPEDFAAHLNLSQRAALNAAVTRRLTLIQGPPGTGKTATSVAILEWWVRSGVHGYDPVLACSDSNTAVDNLLTGAVAAGLRVLRLGRPEAVREDLLQYSIDAVTGQDAGARSGARAPTQKQQRDDRMRAIREAQVICCTCIGSASQLLDSAKVRFSAVLVDEATQATAPATLVPLCRGAEQLVLVGDHCQLPPTVLSVNDGEEVWGKEEILVSKEEKPKSTLAPKATAAAKAAAKAALPAPTVVVDGGVLEANGPGGSAGKYKRRFELTQPLFTLLAERGEVSPYMLDTQYRMHPAIAQFPGDLFYGGRLLDGIRGGDRPEPPGFAWPRSNFPVAFVNVTDGWEGKEGVSKVNQAEIDRVVRIVRDLLNAGVGGQAIGIVTPYAAQVRAMRRFLRDGKHSQLRNVEISSVDGFQGREKEIIVFSAVRSNDTGGIGFLADWRRVNVSFTRAKSGLIVVGNRATLNTDAKTWRLWLDWASANGVIVGKPSAGRYDAESTRKLCPDTVRVVHASSGIDGQVLRNDTVKSYGASSFRGGRPQGLATTKTPGDDSATAKKSDADVMAALATMDFSDTAWDSD